MVTATAVDIVVVGAGAAGVAAAIEAATSGCRVTVLDASPDLGGTAAIAGGGTLIAGSALQHSLGIDDGPDLAYADWLACGGDTVDRPWARRYLDDSATQVYEWLTDFGVEWHTVRWFEANSVPRWHVPRGGGREVMRLLGRAARGHSRISWHLGARVTGLTTAGGRVTGVTAEDPYGPVEYTAAAVLVATGGFSSDPGMLRDHVDVPAGQRILLGGGAGAVGTGHRMLRDLGAGFVNLDAVWMYPYATPDYRDASGLRGLALRRLDGDVWVTPEGQRFHNEALRGGATGTAALLGLPGGTCWSVIDSDIAGRVDVADPYYQDGARPRSERVRDLLDSSPHIARGATIEEVARRAGIDPGGLRRTVDAHNRAVRAGARTDPDFGRPLDGLRPLAAPPFYAIQFFPLARKNLGGVRTDPHCRVLDDRGAVIPGLFAAGEVAGMAGGHINGRSALEGTMLGPSLYSGRVAGSSMAA